MDARTYVRPIVREIPSARTRVGGVRAGWTLLPDGARKRAIPPLD